MNVNAPRFVKPVSAVRRMTIHVRLPAGQAGFTVKASSSRLSGKKVDQAPAPKRSGDGAEKRTPEDPAEAGQVVAKGIVKFLVDVFDETGETVAIATILTMVKKLDQS